MTMKLKADNWKLDKLNLRKHHLANLQSENDFTETVETPKFRVRKKKIIICRLERRLLRMEPI